MLLQYLDDTNGELRWDRDCSKPIIYSRFNECDMALPPKLSSLEVQLVSNLFRCRNKVIYRDADVHLTQPSIWTRDIKDSYSVLCEVFERLRRDYLDAKLYVSTLAKADTIPGQGIS